MLFERKQYLQQLITAEGNGMIKIITGIRRCGKSFLLFNTYKQNLLSRGIPAGHIIEVNIEDRHCKKLRNPVKDMLQRNHLRIVICGYS